MQKNNNFQENIIGPLYFFYVAPGNLAEKRCMKVHRSKWDYRSSKFQTVNLLTNPKFYAKKGAIVKLPKIARLENELMR